MILTAPIILAALALNEASCHRPRLGSDPTTTHSAHFKDPEGALFLTPYILDNDLDTARNLSRVGRLRGESIPSYSGYLTVNKEKGSNILFWFFPAMENAEKAPLILWLTGGPGKAFMTDLFMRNGPYVLTSTLDNQIRNHSWVQKFSMLYVDSPVGTGFSFTKEDYGYCTNDTEVTTDLFEMLRQFFILFSEYAHNDFCIAGNSFAGKFIPALAHAIHEKLESKIQLKGIAIGNGVTDPVSQLVYADFWYQIGLIDKRVAALARELEEEIQQKVREGDYKEASKVDGQLVGYDDSVFDAATGLSQAYNFVDDPTYRVYFYKLLNISYVRRTIHVGNANYEDSSEEVAKKLHVDGMRSAKHWFTVLIEKYKVLLYVGQLDAIVPYAGVRKFADSVEWSGSDDLLRATRKIWYSPQSTEPAGYVRQAKQFTEVLIRNTGHAVITDHGIEAFDLIDRFINDKPFN